MKDLKKIFFQIVGAAMLLMTIYFVIQLIETFSHHYTSNSMKYEEARVFFNEVCKNTELIKWESIYEKCRQQREILKRNPLWETIVDTSKLFHVCYKKKHLHDENKQFGHDHEKTGTGGNDDDIDCSFLAVFAGGILTAFLIIVCVLKYCGNNSRKMKSKME